MKIYNDHQKVLFKVENLSPISNSKTKAPLLP